MFRTIAISAFALCLTLTTACGGMEPDPNLPCEGKCDDQVELYEWDQYVNNEMIVAEPLAPSQLKQAVDPYSSTEIAPLIRHDARQKLLPSEELTREFRRP